MKKFLGIAALIAFLFVLAGCGGETTTAATTTASSQTATTTTTATTVTEAPTTTATTSATEATTTVSTVVTGAITWAGLEDATVVRGDTVDLLAGVTATDSIDGDITADITVSDDGDFTSALAGGYDVTYTVTNSTGVTSTETKHFSVLVKHNVANGDFALDGYAWSLDIPGGAATVAYDDGQAEVSITNPGNSWWGIQFYQTNVLFEAGKTYRLSFEASSANLRSIAGGFEDINGGYAMMLPGFQSQTLTATMSEYEVFFTADDAYGNVKVVIYLGYQQPADEVTGDPHVVTLDNINVEIVEANDTVTFAGVEDEELFSGHEGFNPMAGVSATDAASADITASVEAIGVVPTEVKVGSTYVVTYVVKHEDDSVSFVHRSIGMALAKDFEYQVVNGSFDNGLTGWVQDVNQTNGTGDATFTDNGDGTVSILTTDASNAAWHIQLQQAACTFKAGETYVVRLIAKADTSRKVNVEIVDPSDGFAQIAPTLVGAVLGTDWTVYEIEFTATKDYEFAKVGLLLGTDDPINDPADGVTVTVDELQVYKYDAFNEEFATTNEPWVYDHVDGQIVDGSVVVTFVETGAATGTVAGSDPWNNQLYQSSGSELVAGHTYKVEVYLKSSVARTIRVWIEDAANNYAGIATDAKTELALAADTYALLTYEVVITEANDTTNAKFVVMFGDAGIAGTAHVVTIDYFRITDVTNVE
ncbi:MAG: carbohydrate binding domain-containing protein [Bacilli bacterium]|nr:carbohydrate binding domain-containing protein [Bacilli bacterium]